MAKTAIIHARTESVLKKDVERVFKTLGLSTTEAINLFFQQVKLRQGLPFAVEIPNKANRQAFKDSEAGKGLTECSNIDAMFKKLGI
jgi:DNA-damage-inducible protein J